MIMRIYPFCWLLSVSRVRARLINLLFSILFDINTYHFIKSGKKYTFAGIHEFNAVISKKKYREEEEEKNWI